MCDRSAIELEVMSISARVPEQDWAAEDRTDNELTSTPFHVFPTYRFNVLSPVQTAAEPLRSMFRGLWQLAAKLLHSAYAVPQRDPEWARAAHTTWTYNLMNTQYSFASAQARRPSRTELEPHAQTHAKSHTFAMQKIVRAPVIVKPTIVEIAAKRSQFSPLVQDFLDECGYSDK